MRLAELDLAADELRGVQHDEQRVAVDLDFRTLMRVVRVFDVTRTRQLTYIVMEFIDGDSLAATLKRQGPMSPVEVLRIGMEGAPGSSFRVTLAQHFRGPPCAGRRHWA